MATANQYTELSARLEGLLRRHAVLEAQAKERKERRCQIEAQLRELGVDPTNLEKEEARLKAEEEQAVVEATRLMDVFEKALDSPNKGSATGTSMTETIPVEEEKLPTPTTEDIDI